MLRRNEIVIVHGMIRQCVAIVAYGVQWVLLKGMLRQVFTLCVWFLAGGDLE